MGMVKKKIAVAPMMDWTDRHCRYFMRILSPSARLYTEMVTAAALRHGDADKLLEFNEIEHPLALQIGGSEPELMAHAAKLGAEKGYDEININVGCPSDRVRSGSFGACLMARPGIVADCIKAMQAVSEIPVTVKTRIGIDDLDSYEFVRNFIAAMAAAGCETIVVHARIAILSGLNPKQNRAIPPLNYDRVYRLKQAFPELTIVLNGGIRTVDQVIGHLEHVDGVMIGREAYQNPWFLTELEQEFGDQTAAIPPGREAAVEEMLPYIQQQLQRGALLKNMTRHMLGLFAGQSGARAWRRSLSEHAHHPDAGVDVVHRALSHLRQAA
jgi:tRNA-dihydrouridine synthase A